MSDPTLILKIKWLWSGLALKLVNERVLYLPVGHRKIGDFVIVSCNALGWGKSRLTSLPYDLKLGWIPRNFKTFISIPNWSFSNLLDKYYTSILKTYHFDKDIGIVALEPADDNFWCLEVERFLQNENVEWLCDLRFAFGRPMTVELWYMPNPDSFLHKQNIMRL